MLRANKTAARLLVMAAFGLVLALTPRLRTEPSTTPDLLSRPESGMPSNNGYPALARSANGDVWLAWASRRTRDPRRFGSNADLVQYDQIFLKRRNASGWSKEIRISPDASLDSDPAVAAGDAGAWIIWNRREKGRSSLWTRRVGSDLKLEQPIVIAQDAAYPKAVALPDGGVRVVWESSYGIYSISLSQGVWSVPERISDAGGNAYRPALSLSASGVLSVVWDGGGAERYGIFLRQWDRGRWGEIRRAPAPPGLDAYAPSVAAASGSGAWIAYAQSSEGTAEWGLRGWRAGAAPRPAVRAVLWTGERWEAPGRHHRR